MNADITQDEADKLFAMEKHYLGTEQISLPLYGGRKEIPLHSEDKREEFLLDVSRGSSIALHRMTYQNRVRTTIILVRVDFGSSTHRNPDGEVLPCPHIHLYRVGYGDKWAYPLPDSFDKNALMQDFIQTFMDYCHVVTKPVIEMEMFT